MTVPRNLSKTGVLPLPSVHWPPISSRARRVPVSWATEANAVLPFLDPREIDTGDLVQIVERLELARLLSVVHDGRRLSQWQIDDLPDVVCRGGIDVHLAEVPQRVSDDHLLVVVGGIAAA